MIRGLIKKLGRRAAGTWGRVNAKKDKRAAAKAARKFHDDTGEYDEFPRGGKYDDGI